MAVFDLSQLTELRVQHELPERLLEALERRWFDQFDIRQVSIKPHLGGDLQAQSRFIQLLEIAHGQDTERSLHLLNMQNVLSCFRDGTHSVVFSLRSQGRHVAMHMGVRRFVPEVRVQTVDYVDVLRRTLRSNFPGIALSQTPLSHQACEEEILCPVSESKYLAGITGIPSLKHESGAPFTQSLDRLIDALRGEDYSLLLIAEPITESVIEGAVRRCRELSNEIHGLVRQSMARSTGRTVGDAISVGQATTASAGTGGLLGMLFSLQLGRSWSIGRTEQTSDSIGLSVNQESLNKTAEFCEKLLDHYLRRLQNGRNLGFWNVGFYVASNDFNTFLRTQGLVRGLFSGKDTHFEPLRILNLTDAPTSVRDSLAALRNPGLASGPGAGHPLGEEFQQLATPLTAEELSLLLSLPRREVPGVKLTPMADFGLNPPITEGISLGRVIYRGDTLADEITIPLRKLTQHAFVTGITGAGKTNTCLVILREAHRNGIPFLVIEPAKTEYRPLLLDNELGQDLWVFTLGNEELSNAPFRLNPFEFTPGFPLLTHIDMLKAVFNAAFPMYASMPFILEEAILEVYAERGWDIARSTNRFVSSTRSDFTPYLPRLEHLYQKIDEVVASKKYAQQLTMDISAALKARLKSLLIGGKGYMLNVARSIPFGELLKRPAVLELRRMGDDDEKAFVMALLLVRLYEEREVSGPSSDLVHLTLIEEAHRLLRNVSTNTSMESANPRGKAVEMFTDILAEVREYGEGMIIVDQIPAKLAPDVVKNTNLKILHRIVAQDDRDFVGNAMNLTPFQKEHVVRLKPGQAVVHSEGLDEPILMWIRSVKDEAKQQLDQSQAAVKYQAEIRRIRNQCAASYRRWPGCETCCAPCEFMSDLNQPDEQSLRVFGRIFNEMIFAQPDLAGRRIEEGLTTIRRTFELRDHLTGSVADTFKCHLVQLAHTTIAAWTDYYLGKGGPQQIVAEAEQQTVAILVQIMDQPRSPVATAIADLQQKWYDGITRQPQTPKSGCDLCRRKCRYGFVVQKLAPAPQGTVAKEIAAEAQKDESFKGNYARLVKFMIALAQKRSSIPIAPVDLHHLGYCYLVNGIDRKHILQNYQRIEKL